MKHLTAAVVSREAGRDPAVVETLELPQRGLTALADDLGFRLRSIRRLDLSKNALTDVAGLTGMRTLSWLSLAANKISSLEPLSGLTSLSVLNISRNSVASLAPLAALSGCLRALIANDNALTTTDGLVQVGAVLNTLVLSRNRLETLGTACSQLTQLKKLNVAENALRTIPDCIGAMRELQELRLNGNKITRILPGVLDRLPHLRILDLGNNALATFRDLDQLSELKELRQLNLVGNPLHANVVEYLARIAVLLPRLTVLDGKKLSPDWIEEAKKALAQQQSLTPVPAPAVAASTKKHSAREKRKREETEHATIIDAAIPSSSDKRQQKPVEVAPIEEQREKQRKPPQPAAISGIVCVKDGKVRRNKPKAAVLKQLLADPTDTVISW